VCLLAPLLCLSLPACSGKTTLALHAIAEVQKAGGQAVFVDAGEGAGAGRGQRSLAPAGARVVQLLLALSDAQPPPLLKPLCVPRAEHAFNKPFARQLGVNVNVS
jgi:RecA/RadA recombinase